MAFTILDESQGFTIQDAPPAEKPKRARDPALDAPMTRTDEFLASLPNWMTGNIRGSAVGRVAMGAADPGVAIAQAAANFFPDATGIPQAVNERIKSVEGKYQNAREDAGSTGFDPLRLLGTAAITAPLTLASAPAATLAGTVAKGAAQGAGFGLLNPVTDAPESYWLDKAKQAGMGAAGGAALAPVAGALARLVSPKASVNPDLALLRQEGVNPTIGQAMGGTANRIEEKLTSVPIVGDAITAARRRGVEQFNEAAINRATNPVGASVKGSGQDAVKAAGNAVSDAYEKALGSIKGVAFDTPTFNANLGQLQQMSESLIPPMKQKFDKALSDLVVGRMSPNGHMLPETFKMVDSDLGKMASRYSGSQNVAEQELGDALKQLKAIMWDEVKSSSPQAAEALKAADKGWANLVRVEGAAKSAKNAEGVFTPAQLSAAVQGADRSVRKRAVSRGDALMQDLATAGQNVLGNRYPDSGTAGRAFLAGSGVGLGTGLIHPAIPAAMLGGAAAYSAPVQNALVYLLTRRPDVAPQAANALRRLAGPLSVGGYSLSEESR